MTEYPVIVAGNETHSKPPVDYLSGASLLSHIDFLRYVKAQQLTRHWQLQTPCEFCEALFQFHRSRVSPSRHVKHVSHSHVGEYLVIDLLLVGLSLTQ